MPYIEKERAEKVDAAYAAYGNIGAEAGDLTWLLSAAVRWYMDEYEISFDVISDILGALESTKQEFYRRVVVPYEAVKIHQATLGERDDPFA